MDERPESNSTESNSNGSEEYRALREEILQLQERRSRYLVGGPLASLGIEALIGFAKGSDGVPGVLLMVLAVVPVLVLVSGIAYLATSYAIMRAGAFIRFELPSYGKWEKWLENGGNAGRRGSDSMTQCS